MGAKVLIADDEPNIVVSLSFMMKREGYEVLVAPDGTQALEMIRRERPELVLLDAMMPGMSGFDLCEAVRADADIRETPILMLTAKGRETDQARGMGAGANAYVTKPFSTSRSYRQGQGDARLKLDRCLVAAALAPGAALAGWLLAGGLLLVATLDPDGRSSLAAITGGRGAMVFGWWLLAAALGAWAVSRLYERHVAAAARLADAARVLAGDAGAPALVAAGAWSLRVFAGAVNRLADERRELSATMAGLVEEASRKVAHERDQLGALMAELRQSVIVCNPEGRILLYNERSRALFQRLSRAPESAGGAELIGLGRSIHGVIDEGRLAHARESVERRLARGDAAASARFVMTTPAGNLLQVILAPVRPEAAGAATNGFVLLLDDITDDYAEQTRRDRRLAELTEASRASLASMQAALDILDYPDLEAAEQAGFHRVLRDEVGSLGVRLAGLAADAGRDRLSRWPLQDMLGSDLLTAAAQRIEAVSGQAVRTAETEALWLSVDSFSLTQALAFLAGRLMGLPARPGVELRLSRAGALAHLDLAWPAQEATTAAVAAWQSEAISSKGEASALSARDIAERHGGEVWLEHDRERGVSFFRFLLPLAAGGREETRLPERPEFYDFDLLAASGARAALDDRPLEALAYTVFDAETTGLDPAGGDEILQLGAVRIVNGKLLSGECFDQIVDPGRSIPEASIPFHGIRPDMVRGRPRIGEVLPAFHAFAADTVLVGHNVAFDLRFLQTEGGCHGTTLRPAGARHAAPRQRGPAARTFPRAGEHRRPARGGGHGSALGPGRRADDGTGLPEAAADPARTRNCDARSGPRGGGDVLLFPSQVLIERRENEAHSATQAQQHDSSLEKIKDVGPSCSDWNPVAGRRGVGDRWKCGMQSRSPAGGFSPSSSPWPQTGERIRPIRRTR